MIRTILSPGVELNEVDKSQYTSNAGFGNRALVMGFASRGPNKTPTQITSMIDFQTIYGTPNSEAERYFYNGVDIMLGSGATVVAAKIPYANDKGYVAQQYRVGEGNVEKSSNIESVLGLNITDRGSDATENEAFSILSSSDSTIKSMTNVEEKGAVLLNSDKFDSLENGSRSGMTGVLPENSFLIVDKTKSAYKTYTGSGSNVECLGILPVVTTAANALAIAYELSGVNMDSDISSEIVEKVNLFESLKDIDYIPDWISGDTDPEDDPVELDVQNTEISDFWEIGANTKYNANTLNSISKNAAQFFPTINYATNATTNMGTSSFDRTYFSWIGVVVYQIKVNKGTGNLFAEPVESFAGSLLKDAKDLRTNASVFIENIINTTSNYISIYVDDNLSENKSNLFATDRILWAKPSNGVILGLPKSAAKKTIKYSDISKAIDDVFGSYSNVLASTLDVVVDAGMSTIAQAVNGSDEGVEFDPVRNIDLSKRGNWSAWRAIVNKYKKFCDTTRKDCVFVCDSPRDFSLIGSKKVVSPYDIKKSVSNDILPYIKNIAGVNTSYGWGYAIWYLIGDAYSGQSFWCPPSIFGANCYVRTRTRWNVWDAPAGLTRGVISVDDTSFEPDLNARNTLYSNAWNYSLTYVQNGATCLEGQKTFQTKTSAFDRINVRSLFLYLERQVFAIARDYVYEPNTVDIRQQFVDNITPIFDGVLAAGGCYAYKIICDETINTPQTIDNNELRVRIGVQPTKTIEFILIEFVATRTGSNWSELVEE